MTNTEGPPYDPQDPSFCGGNSMTALVQYTQPPSAGGLVNTVIYARAKYGTRPPDGYTPNLSTVIDLLTQLRSSASAPPLSAQIEGSIEYLTYLNQLLSAALPQAIEQLISAAVNLTLD